MPTIYLSRGAYDAAYVPLGHIPYRPALGPPTSYTGIEVARALRKVPEYTRGDASRQELLDAAALVERALSAGGAGIWAIEIYTGIEVARALRQAPEYARGDASRQELLDAAALVERASGAGGAGIWAIEIAPDPRKAPYYVDNAGCEHFPEKATRGEEERMQKVEQEKKAAIEARDVAQVQVTAANARVQMAEQALKQEKERVQQAEEAAKKLRADFQTAKREAEKIAKNAQDDLVKARRDAEVLTKKVQAELAAERQSKTEAEIAKLQAEEAARKLQADLAMLQTEKLKAEEIAKKAQDDLAALQESSYSKPVKEISLYIAAEMGDEATVRQLANTATVNVKDASGFTPLINANNKIIAQILVDAGADIHATTANGFTALHKAAITGNFDLVEFLVQHEAEVDARDNIGSTPLMLAATIPIADLLFKAGADIMVRDKDGFTVLHSAIACTNLAVLEFFLSKGVSPNIPDNAGIVPLKLMKDNKEVRELLIKHGADPSLVKEDSSSDSGLESGASLCSPCASLSPAVKGKGHGSETDGVSPRTMVAYLEAARLQCPIEFSRYQDLSDTVLRLESKALIELMGDGPAHWVLKITVEETIFLIWPEEIPAETLVLSTPKGFQETNFVSSGERPECTTSYMRTRDHDETKEGFLKGKGYSSGIVVVPIHQNPGECAAAALNYLAMLEASGHLLLESSEPKSEDTVSTCTEVSNSLFETIINYAVNFNPSSFLQQQLHWLQELIQDGLSNEWLNSDQKFQLQALFFDVGASLSLAVPFGGPGDDGGPGGDGGAFVPDVSQGDDSTGPIPTVNVSLAGDSQ